MSSGKGKVSCSSVYSLGTSCEGGKARMRKDKKGLKEKGGEVKGRIREGRGNEWKGMGSMKEVKEKEEARGLVPLRCTGEDDMSFLREGRGRYLFLGV